MLFPKKTKRKKQRNKRKGNTQLGNKMQNTFKNEAFPVDTRNNSSNGRQGVKKRREKVKHNKRRA